MDPLYQQILKRVVGGGLDIAEFFAGDPKDPTTYLTPLAGPAVAAVKPELIGKLREHGADIIKKLKAEGLERRAMGFRPPDVSIPPEKLPKWKLRDGKEVIDWQKVPRVPNRPIPPEMMEALEFAQKKYPRIFGHLTTVADVDAYNQLMTGQRTLGSSGPVVPSLVPESLKALNPDIEKLSSLHLSPSVIKRQADPAYQVANTTGHELLHTADRIVDPKNFTDKYKFSQELPGGYDANNFEIRANLQGDKFANDLQKTKSRKVPITQPSLFDVQAERASGKSFSNIFSELIDKYKKAVK
jgi:hypothetical protein